MKVYRDHHFYAVDARSWQLGLLRPPWVPRSFNLWLGATRGRMGRGMERCAGARGGGRHLHAHIEINSRSFSSETTEVEQVLPFVVVFVMSCW